MDCDAKQFSGRSSFWNHKFNSEPADNSAHHNRGDQGRTKLRIDGYRHGPELDLLHVVEFFNRVGNWGSIHPQRSHQRCCFCRRAVRDRDLQRCVSSRIIRLYLRGRPRHRDSRRSLIELADVRLPPRRPATHDAGQAELLGPEGHGAPRREGFRIYYRVLVNSVEKPSLVFMKVSDRTVYGESALEKWCAKNVDKLESGTVVEAKLSEEIA